MKGHRDLRLVTTATAVCAIGSLITPLGETRIVFAVPLTLFLPGYAIAAAISSPRRIRGLELVPLGIGISLVALVLGSIVLNYTPGGLRGAPWALLLLLVVLGSCRIAAKRRRPMSTRRRERGIAVPKLTPTAAALAIGCVALTAAALVLAQTTLHADRALGYTELWMIPPDESDRIVRIGVTSQQQEATAYRLRVRFENQPKPVVRSFMLAPGESRTLALDPGPHTRAIPVKAELFKRGDPLVVYRHVFSWIPAAEKASP